MSDVEESDGYEDDTSSEGSESDSEDGKRPLSKSYERSTVSSIRMSSTLQEERRLRDAEHLAETAIDPGLRTPGPAENVRRLLLRRYGTCTHGWREALDRRGRHRIGRADFFVTLRELGFAGNATAAWCELLGANPREVASPKQRQLTLADVDASAAELLSVFYRHFTDEVGRLAKLMRNCDSLRLGEAEFIARCGPLGKQHFDRAAVDLKAVFKQLQSHGAVTQPDIDWLQDYCTREQRRESSPPRGAEVRSPEEQRLRAEARAAEAALHTKKINAHKVHAKEGRPTSRRRRRAAKQSKTDAAKRVSEAKSEKDVLLQLLEQRFDSPMRAWARVLDPKHKGKVKAGDFLVGCSAVGFRGSRSRLLEELGLEAGGTVHLRHIAPDVIEETKRFKQLASGKLGSVVKSVEATQAVDKNKTPLELKLKAFKKICTRIGYDGSAERMFSHLDLGGEGALSTKLLHKSDPSKGKQEKGLPKLQDLRAKQDGLLKAGRERRHERKTNDEMKKEFLRHLEKGIGSVPRAWRLAFDPDNRGEVEPEAFLEGLTSSGWLDPEAEDDELQEARQLFQMLADEETDVITLEGFDPRTAQALYDFRCRLAARFGGVREAFLEYDPNGTGVVNRQDIRHMCHEARATDHIRRLLEYLDPNDEGKVQLGLLDEGAAEEAKEAAQDAQEAREARQREEGKKGRAHMLTKPRPVGVPCGVEAQKDEREREQGRRNLEEFKRQLVRKHGSLVRAWRKVLQPAAEGPTLDYDDFEGVFETAGGKGDPELAWNALELKGKGGLGLNEFDPRGAEDFRELRARLVERYGSMEKAFDAIDADGSYELDFVGFANQCGEIQFRRNEKRLFAYLDEDGSKRVSLGAIDSKAVEAVKEKREREAEEALAEAAAKGGDAAATLPAQPEQPAATESVNQSARLARAFREYLQQRFGSPIRAWQTMDFEGKVALTRQEFVSAARIIGFAGNASTLFVALGGEEHRLVSLRELDPQAFRLLAMFRDLCDERGGGLRTVFEDPLSHELTKRLSRDEFNTLCRKLHFPKASCEQLFQQLDVHSVGSITWEEVRFLEENWEWEPEPHPLRRKEGTRKRNAVELPGSPSRTDALAKSPLCTSSLKPRSVGTSKVSKSSSLPALLPPVRDNWNDRHHVLDTGYNKDTQLLHLLSSVFTKDRERIRRNVARKMQEMPIMQWVEQQLAYEAREEEDADDPGPRP